MKGLLFTVVSLFFIFLLAVAYFSKRSISNIRNRLYRLLLLNEILLLTSEFTATLCMLYGYSDIVVEIMLRIHWYTAVLWFSLIYYYSIVSVIGVKKATLWDIIKSSSEIKGVTVILLIGNLIFFLFPFNNLYINGNVSYVPGTAAFFFYFFAGLCICLLVAYMLKNKEKVPKNIKISILLLLLATIVIILLQLMLPTIAIQAMGTALYLYLLYFIIENPDLELISELEISKSEIDKSSKAKTDFLSNMSHEIRSPMNAIIGFSESLANGNFDESTVRNDIININQAGNNLLDIINNILDISKIETGKETIELKEYFINNILSELQKIVEARLDAKPIKYIVNIDENMPSKFYGDSVKLFQVLLNILTNSVKYTEVGKIILNLKCDINNNYAVLHFKISDTGYGIKKEDYDKLFEKFSRLDVAINKEIEGTGLGLLITKKYVDLMGGKIWFDSKLHVGTNFYIDLPQKIIDKTPIKNIIDNQSKNKDIEWIDCSSYKALIVDDNKLNLKVEHKLLSKYKFQIDEVSGGKDCIDLVKSDNKYDIIFLDHMMSDIDGIEVLHILKSLKGFDIPPVVALTANAISGMKEKYLKEGFDEYLSKPINIDELNNIIIKYFSK